MFKYTFVIFKLTQNKLNECFVCMRMRKILCVSMGSTRMEQF